ncbi:MAG: phage/plasmid primase, P4 family, partial [Methanospirillum sp.]|uniref:phage/plasmid primase, P4 family n=1 Tax=Methanospirillum sp. TaxID=45200 RepID=UPI002372D3D7
DSDTGEILPDVLDEIMNLGSYAEVSPSGTGVHAICRGVIPGERHRGNKREMYSSGHYFTMTGQILPGSPCEINEPKPGSLEEIYAAIVGKKEDVLGKVSNPYLPPNPLTSLSPQEKGQKSLQGVMGDSISQSRNTINSIVIPEEIKELDDEIRFIKINKNSKIPLEKRWNENAHYSVNDPSLIQWIQSGGNYGFFIREGSDLCILDADDSQSLREVIDFLGDTLTVQSGRKEQRGYHIFFRCQNLDEKKVFLFTYNENGEKVEFGDIRPGSAEGKYYVVGAGSVHPDGKKYEIIKSTPPRVIDKNQFLEIIAPFRLNKKQSKPSHEEATTYRTHQVSVGGRNNYLIQQAGKLRRLGYGYNDLFKALKSINNEVCCPPLDIDEVSKIAGSAMRWEPEDINNDMLSPSTSMTTPHELILTDLGNSEYFSAIFKDSVRYCSVWNKWYIWSGKVWHNDDTDQMLNFASDCVKQMCEDIKVRYHSPDNNHPAMKWAKQSASLPRRKAMLDGSKPLLSVIPTQLDSHPDLFNCENGTYNLANHTFRPHNKDDLLTKISGVLYDETVNCPKWEEHIDLIFAGNEELILAFQEICGYSLLHGNPAEIFLVFWGTGQNGKSKIFGTMEKIFGDYAKNLPFESFLSKKNSGGANNDIASLVGCRLVVASESDDGAVLNTGLIKLVSGGDKVTARFLFGEFFEYDPAYLLVLSTNHKPVVKDWDYALERRIWFFPFTVTIPEEKRDLHIMEKLEAELPGIFNWMIEGLKRYQIRGKLCDRPYDVIEATAEYRRQIDPVSAFIDERCKIIPQSANKEDMILRRDIYALYEDWSTKNNEAPVTQKKFANTLCSRGVKDGNYELHRKLKAWKGIRYTDPSEEQDMTIYSILADIATDATGAIHSLKGTLYDHLTKDQLKTPMASMARVAKNTMSPKQQWLKRCGINITLESSDYMELNSQGYHKCSYQGCPCSPL